jgi:hypothetical protein
MEMIDYLLMGLILLCVGWGVINGIRVTTFLEKKGVKINYFLWRIYIIKYIDQYREITLKETGQVGGLYYHAFVPYIIAFGLALLVFLHLVG